MSDFKSYLCLYFPKFLHFGMQKVLLRYTLPQQNFPYQIFMAFSRIVPVKSLQAILFHNAFRCYTGNGTCIPPLCLPVPVRACESSGDVFLLTTPACHASAVPFFHLWAGFFKITAFSVPFLHIWALGFKFTPRIRYINSVNFILCKHFTLNRTQPGGLLFNKRKFGT